MLINIKGIKLFTHRLFKVSLFNIFKKPKQSITRYLEAEIKLSNSCYKPLSNDQIKFLDQNNHIEISSISEGNHLEIKFKKDLYDVTVHYLGR